MAKKKAKKNKKKAKKRRPSGKGLSFGFLIVALAIVAATGMFILVQHQYTVTGELKVGRIDTKIEAERAEQKSLRVKLAKLKSPARVARLAQDELGMTEPSGVIYLKYGHDANGNLVCQSSYEKVSPLTPSSEPEVPETQPTVTQQESNGTLTKR